MATVRLLNNILEDKVDTFSVKKGTTIEQVIREHSDENVYEGVLVECYDAETGKTYYAPIEEDNSTQTVIAIVNGKDASLNHVLEENDIVEIIITPAGDSNEGNWWGSFWGGIGGALIGALVVIGSSVATGGFGAIVWASVGIGALVGMGVGAVGGWFVGGEIYKALHPDVKNGSSDSGLQSTNLPDVRGSQNQPLLNQSFPLVIGKHLVNPFIIGTPWNEISGDRGQTNYIHILYAVGYAPLRLSDFKLADMFVAHNQKWAKNEDMKNIFHGKLSGYNTSEDSDIDNGDIVNTWRENNIEIEILQQGQNGDAVDYGTNYPYAKIQRDVNANCLYILDESIDGGGSVSYKGVSLKNGLRNNPIQFSEQYAKSLRVELDFRSGLFRTRSEKSGDNHVTRYSKIPCWVAIQWRVYSEANDDITGDEHGVLPLPLWDGEKYNTEKRGWNTFAMANNLPVQTYTSTERRRDFEYHTGQEIKYITTEYETVTHKQIFRVQSMGIVHQSDLWDLYDGWRHVSGETFTVDPNNKSLYKLSEPNRNGNEQWTFTVSYNETVTHTSGEDSDANADWLNASVFNLESLGGTNEDKEGINEFRVISEVNLESWARTNLMSQGDSEETFINKFKDYFYGNFNTAHSIEVRVVRVSPCYIDEQISTNDHSAYTFNDIFTWSTLTSTMYDGDKLKNKNQLVQKRPLSERDMRKLCIVSFKAKTDNTDQLTNTVKKFSCIAQSFAPYYDDTEKKWVPENVQTFDNYYAPDGTKITKAEFEQARQNGIKATRRTGGNDFVKNLVTDVIRKPEHIDNKGRYYIPDNDNTIKYCNNNVASMFLLAGIGPHLGVDALGYIQSGYAEHGLGDFNLTSLATWYKWAEKVTDGSTYGDDGFHYTHDGKYVQHKADTLVEMYFSANAYIYEPQLLDTMLSQIAIAGRSVYTRDNKNRITVVIDKPEKYPVALINQQNTLKSGYNISFADNPSGLQMNYSDENDGYISNSVYCAADKTEDKSDPRGAVEQYGIKFVTNPYQLYSLGRYVLANRLLNKEVVTKQIGMEGASIGLGNLVVLQDETMLIGTDSGGRITKLIENDRTIFGFIINNTYEFTGETEEYENSNHETVLRSTQGVIVMQPSQYKESKVITLRLAAPNTVVTVDGVEYRNIKGQTNLVLFDKFISKTDSSVEGDEIFFYKPEVDNIVGFGKIGQVTATYRVIKIKPDAKRNYELTLCKYQEDLYNAGDVLPSFQNNMTVPDRSDENAFNLSNNSTYADLVRKVTESAEIAKGEIKDTFGNIPDTPDNLVAKVKEDCIQFTCSVDSDIVNTIDHIVYEVSRPDGSTASINGSYSTEYYFNRAIDGYPERDELEGWLFRAKSVSIYCDEDGNPYESEWSDYTTLSSDSLNAYGTWIPPIPVVTSFDAEQEGINAIWTCDTSNVYGSVEYELTVYYAGATHYSFKTVLKNGMYQFRRNVDKYPEKPNTAGIGEYTKTLDNYSVKIKAVNVQSAKYNFSETANCTYSHYKTWIPSAPNVNPRVTNRNITLFFSQNNDCYGQIQYLVGVRRYNDPENVFYYPDLETSPYLREDAYKKSEDGLYVVGKIESDSPYSQTMPLETQNGVQSYLAISEEPGETRVLGGVVSEGQPPRILLISRGGFAPKDTNYQFEVYSFNKTTQGIEDKISVSASRKRVTALATSVMDVMNGAIVSDKIADGAIKETKIEDDAISTPKLRANAVQGDKIYAYNLLTVNEGAHSISGWAYDADRDKDVKELLGLARSKEEVTKKQGTYLLDQYIKERSTNYWIGLDTGYPEFYMGNVTVGNKEAEDANYFHYYTELDPVTHEPIIDPITHSPITNLDIKLSNFIVTAVSSTVKGLFNVRDKKSGRFDGGNSFLQVNPEKTTDSTFGTEAETIVVKGDVILTEGNNSDVTNKTGNLKVQSLGDFGCLSVSKKTSKNGSITVTVYSTDGETFYADEEMTVIAVIPAGAVVTETENENEYVYKMTDGSLRVEGETVLCGELKVPLSLTTLKALKVNETATVTDGKITNSLVVGNQGPADNGIALQVGTASSAKNTKLYGEFTVGSQSGAQAATHYGQIKVKDSNGTTNVRLEQNGNITAVNVSAGTVSANTKVSSALIESTGDLKGKKLVLTDHRNTVSPVAFHLDGNTLTIYTS